jgi:hypothetical protein
MGDEDQGSARELRSAPRQFSHWISARTDRRLSGYAPSKSGWNQSNQLFGAVVHAIARCLQGR